MIYFNEWLDAYGINNDETISFDVFLNICEIESKYNENSLSYIYQSENDYKKRYLKNTPQSIISDSFKFGLLYDNRYNNIEWVKIHEDFIRYCSTYPTEKISLFNKNKYYLKNWKLTKKLSKLDVTFE
jgi:UDP-N-acetylglucosamine pyrophosphorylase